MESLNEYFSGDEMNVTLVKNVDYFPASKERRKLLSLVMTRMYALLHNLNWIGFEQYGKALRVRYPNDIDIETLLAIYEVDSCKNRGDYAAAQAMFPCVEKLLTRCPSSQCLHIRYLTTKVFTLYYTGKQREAMELHEQAVQMQFGPNQATSNMTAYNLVMYALNHCLPRVDATGKRIIPSAYSWEQAEYYYRLGCEQHLVWTRDLNEDNKISSTIQSSFFLFSFVRYIFTLIRSCAVDEFDLFEMHTCPRHNLTKAAQCIERVKTQEHMLTDRTHLEFAILLCDYHLRLAEFAESDDEKCKFYDRSEKFLLKAMSVVDKLNDSTHIKSGRHVIDSRMTFITRKRLTLYLEYQELLPDSVLSLNRMDYFKAEKHSADEESVLADTSEPTDTTAPKQYSLGAPRPIPNSQFSSDCAYGMELRGPITSNHQDYLSNCSEIDSATNGLQALVINNEFDASNTDTAPVNVYINRIRDQETEMRPKEYLTESRDLENGGENESHPMDSTPPNQNEMEPKQYTDDRATHVDPSTSDPPQYVYSMNLRGPSTDV